VIVRKRKESSFPVFQLKEELQKRGIPITRFAEALGISTGAIHGHRPFPDEKAEECWKLLHGWPTKGVHQDPGATDGARANAALSI
jgi:hypothetical protein